MHRAVASGNLRPAMHRLRVTGLLLLVALIVWLAVRSCTPGSQQSAPVQPPPREVFHASKPLRVELTQTANDASAMPIDWLERELRYVLTRGKMKLAAFGDGPADAGPKAAATKPFTLRVAMEPDSHATLSLIAPDQVVERSERVALDAQSHLSLLQSLVDRLPPFLGAPTGNTPWKSLLGTNDAPVYEAYVDASRVLLQAQASGFTAPPEPTQETVHNVERLEKLARKNRDFARARSLLALAYLSVGGEDEDSLTKLAETAADRALTLDAQLADAHAVLGIVRLRRMGWSAAQEHFERALELDPSSVPALEGLGCLLMDTGHAREALPIATRAANLQPGNRGARQCARYAQIANGSLPEATEPEPFDVAKIRAAMLLLAGDRPKADAVLREDAKTPADLIQAVIAASDTKERTPEALQMITRTADEETIDAETELLFGTALRRPDFVFNRMLRLAKQNEAIPLRLLWLPQTDFLRKQRRFKEVVSAAALTTYWQDHGPPDICAKEPKVNGCAVKAK